MADWVPLIKKRIEPFAIKEKFVDEQQSVTIVTTIFTVMAAMLGAALVAMLFYWSYQREVSLFIAIICMISFLYAVENVIFIAIKRTQVSDITFRFYLGSGIFIALMNLFMFVYFAVKANSRIRGGYGGVSMTDTGYNSQ